LVEEISSMVELSDAAALVRRQGLQRRLTAGSDTAFCPRTAVECFQWIRSYLIKASDQRLLAQSPSEVRTLLPRPVSTDASGTYDIAVGNVRNFRRDRALPHFSRMDGAWFDFQLLVRQHAGATSILAYGFELRLPHERPFPFVRFDLNPPGHDNDGDGLRSHLHLGTDDDGFSIPAPVMSPLEILDLFLLRLRSGPRNRM
jgi:hypothetical protein